jgi:TonB family protein
MRSARAGLGLFLLFVIACSSKHTDAPFAATTLDSPGDPNAEASEGFLQLGKQLPSGSPLFEVIAGDTRDTVHLGSNPAKIDVPPPSRSGAASSTAAERGPATVAAERVQMSLAKATIPPQESPYPLLGRQMKVQGSVLLQAFIGADGVIRDLRVLSGPAILASAAREAARRWQFKPYLENGQPVETQAKITVNFTIKVLENGARDQMGLDIPILTADKGSLIPLTFVTQLARFALNKAGEASNFKKTVSREFNSVLLP